MPELPEVETTRRGISPYVSGEKISEVIVRQAKLRWPVPSALPQLLKGKKIKAISRRAKYLLFETSSGHMLIHLGMSGSLRINEKKSVARKHDHIDFFLTEKVLRFHDPRRFGSVLWTKNDPLQHKLLANLGPEPLSADFTAKYLHAHAKNKKVAIKNFIMNSQIVVGVGNIYASEALFMSGIHPQRMAGKVSLQRYETLVKNIRLVLTQAIKVGGTSLRDFVREDGAPGYFANQLNVYNKKGQPCVVCKEPIKMRVVGQRSSFYCSRCQH